MTTSRLIPASDAVTWTTAVEACAGHDVYHLPEYHLVPTPLASGEPWLVHVSAGPIEAAVPFYVRSIEGSSHVDAVSAYGYPGIICSRQEPDQSFADAFQSALASAFGELGVVAWFGRQHPLFDTAWLVAGRAEVADLGQTVLIATDRAEDEIRALANSNHRRNLIRTEKLEPTVLEDPGFERIDDFMAVYDATMIRNGARSDYLFDRSYYTSLKSALGDKTTMFHVVVDDALASSVIAFHHQGIVQYHLGGTAGAFAREGTARYALESVRRWATAHGYRWFHLGGGVGAGEDSLFRFKAGFAKTFARYKVVKWVQDRTVYEELVAGQSAASPDQRPGFFPAYRQ